MAREQRWKWLYSSTGDPVAFVFDEAVYRNDGAFLGALSGRMIVNGRYVGEILQDDLIVRARFQPVMQGERCVPVPPPYLPTFPGRRAGAMLPFEYQDLAVG